MNMFKKNGGFTLVELIVVIAILAILAAVAVPAYNGYIGKANEAADTTALSAVKTAAQAHCATKGEVVKIVVTATDVDIFLADGADADTDLDEVTDHLTAGSDFLTFMNQTSFSITLKTGNTATWDNSTGAAAATKGQWVITTAN